MSRHNFKKMKIWQDAMILSDSIFKITKSFPKSEIYNLTSQINRSTISVPSNIAEGSSRSSNKEFNRYLEIKIEELQKMISGFQNALK
jgi:four helix bundle protein